MPHYPLHLPTFDYLGFDRYFLTFCTFERNSYFANTENVCLVREQILRAGAQHQFAIIAYCFMPDHVHLVVEGTREDADLKAFVARAGRRCLSTPPGPAEAGPYTGLEPAEAGPMTAGPPRAEIMPNALEDDDRVRRHAV